MEVLIGILLLGLFAAILFGPAVVCGLMTSRNIDRGLRDLAEDNPEIVAERKARKQAKEDAWLKKRREKLDPTGAGGGVVKVSDDREDKASEE